MVPQVRGASFVGLLLVAALLLRVGEVEAQGLVYKFYSKTCPRVETIIKSEVQSLFKKDPTIAPGILRLEFHDCFVRGCDASVLLAGRHTERASPINTRLHGFDAIDTIKAALEKACPNTVSCADILAYAARDSVVVTGGSSWKVYGGRRDGTISNEIEPEQNIPGPTATYDELIATFAEAGIGADQMVDLSGAHTIGITHCDHIANRIYTPVDPTLPKTLLKTLLKICPKSTVNTPIVLDQTSQYKFDTAYFKNVYAGKGVMTSDQQLMNPAAFLQSNVKVNLKQSTFVHRFGQAMTVMSGLQPLIYPDGEIRKHCQYVN